MSEMTQARFALAHAIAVLERTPAAFRALLAGLPDAWTTPNEGPETFSAFDNVGHLVHGERTDWIPRARIILEHGRAARSIRTTGSPRCTRAEGRACSDLLDELARLRAQNLATLRGWQLTDRELALEGEHPALGPRHARAAAGDVGGARPRAPRADGARDGEAVPRRQSDPGAPTCRSSTVSIMCLERAAHRGLDERVHAHQ